MAELNPQNYKSILNTLYHVYPVAFEMPRMQRRIRELFAPYNQPISLFDLNIARLYRHNDGLKVAICCMPKSGSTFVLTSLKRVAAFAFDTVHLQSPYMNIDFVEALSREHEVDELSLLIHEMRGKNWLSHMHTKWTPYTERIFLSHHIKPIVTYRNIFDCLVSMDDMFMSGEVDGFSMIRLPKGYRSMPDPERLSFLTNHAGPWYVDYVVAWSRVRMDCLRLNYETDVVGFGEETARKIYRFLGDTSVSFETFLDAFELNDDAAKRSARLNKGVAGRGEKIPVEARDRLKELARIYEAEADFSGLL